MNASILPRVTVSSSGFGGGSPEESWVHVLFKGRRVEPYMNPDRVPVALGAVVAVEVERGFDLGEVTQCPVPDATRRHAAQLRRILRLATPEEVERLQALRREDAAALDVAKQRVSSFQLPMHVVDAEHQFDGNRVSFFFTADHRIDFRELVRDLAGIYRTRIELRQIGTREAARRLGGIGPCGRELCCCTFLCDFEHVSLHAARGQRPPASLSKISGLCGRLMCCLAYEGRAPEASCSGGADCPAAGCVPPG